MNLRQKARAAAARRFPDAGVRGALVDSSTRAALRYGFALGMLYGWQRALKKGQGRGR
jgi:hypothetical protein